jgi:T4 RnlA family RNA ligase
MHSNRYLCNHLIALTKGDNETFFFTAGVRDNVRYRILSYRLASYSAWLANGSALKCRGITFEMNGKISVRLALCPFEKVLQPAAIPLRWSLTTRILPKFCSKRMVRSLISSMLLSNGNVHLKSKGSLNSKEAKAAMKMLQHETLSTYVFVQ